MKEKQSLTERKAELRDATKRANFLADRIGGESEEVLRGFSETLYEEYKSLNKQELETEFEKQRQKMLDLSSL